jgi:hypothetical protein
MVRLSHCGGDPGTSQEFEINFFLDKEGLPAAEPIYSIRTQARISETKTKIVDSFGNHFEVYPYSADSLPPLSIPAGQRAWVVISQGPRIAIFSGTAAALSTVGLVRWASTLSAVTVVSPTGSL